MSKADPSDNFDHIREEVLASLDQGDSYDTILETFPRHKKEIGELLKTISFIKSEGQEVVPRREVLERILANLEVASLMDEVSLGSRFDEFSHTLKVRLGIMIPACIMATLFLIVLSNNLLPGGLGRRVFVTKDQPESSQGENMMRSLGNDMDETVPETEIAQETKDSGLVVVSIDVLNAGPYVNQELSLVELDRFLNTLAE